MLPDGLIALYRSVRNTPPSTLFAEQDAKECLESLLRGVIFPISAYIRQREELRAAILHFLDHLVDEGHSSAYLMRDMIVSPLPPPK
jgi:hypothetical protein